MKERDGRIDVIRLVALACLITVHFILKMELYNTKVAGGEWTLICLMRQFGMCCIPLFLLITGYLMGKKPYSRGYYKKILRTIGIYILASAASNFWVLATTGDGRNINGLIIEILEFTACPYAWYVELYIGLFMIIPFLNNAYEALDKKGRTRLIVIMMVLTGLPSFVNVYRLGSIEWWLTPSTDASYFKIIPAYWRGAWPITYYFLGCWIRDRQIAIKRSVNIALIVLCSVLFALYNYWRSLNSSFIWGEWQDWGSWMNTILSVLIFLLLLNTPYKIRGKYLPVLANAVFGAYLLSWIPEQVVYKKVISDYSDPISRIKYYPLAFVVYIASLALSLVLSGLYDISLMGINKLRKVKTLQ